MSIQTHPLRLAAAPLIAIIAGNATIATLHTHRLGDVPHALTGLALLISLRRDRYRHRISEVPPRYRHEPRGNRLDHDVRPHALRWRQSR